MFDPFNQWLPVRAMRAPRRSGNARAMYFELLSRSPESDQREQLRKRAGRFLDERLAAAALLPDEFPEDLSALPEWLARHSRETGARYQQYLAERREGSPRRYFSNRSHALHFLRAVAPTKLVDGAWLHGVLPAWQDPTMAPLIRTYLEELGDGDPHRNHVAVYRGLVERHGLESWTELDDEHFTQGALQLALGCAGPQYRLEVIGFNLGYEQLPLHLLITARELAEVGIDPYYFSLHVTIDNASTGHARKAIEAVADALPGGPERSRFQRRMANGFALNQLGVGTCDAIDAFDLDREVTAMLGRKAALAQGVHSDRCRIEGLTINEWLADRSAAEFLDALETSGWVRRGCAPDESRFWRMIVGARAPMFGVFSDYERQLLSDWIARGTAPDAATGALRLPSVFPAAQSGKATANAGNLPQSPDDPADVHECDADAGQLQQLLRRCPDASEQMRMLIERMTPAEHYRPEGLLATRMFIRLFDRTARSFT